MSVGSGPKAKCHGCKRINTPTLMVCSGCKFAKYCTVDCQNKHWKTYHKSVCKRLTAFIALKGEKYSVPDPMFTMLLDHAHTTGELWFVVTALGSVAIWNHNDSDAYQYVREAQGIIDEMLKECTGPQ